MARAAPPAPVAAVNMAGTVPPARLVLSRTASTTASPSVVKMKDDDSEDEEEEDLGRWRAGM